MNNNQNNSMYNGYQNNNNQNNGMYNGYQNNNNQFINQQQTPIQPVQPNGGNTAKSKKVMKIVMIVALVATIALVGGFALVYTGVIKIGAVEPKAILLNASSIGVKRGKDYQYDYQVYPESSTAKNVYYESSDPSIADVNRITGYVTPRKEGTVIVSVRSSEDDSVIETSNLSITKNKVAIDNLELSSERIVFDLSNKSKSQLLKVFTQPYNATVQDLTFSSSDESVAQVDPTGRVYPVGFGIATITVRTEEGNANATCEVIVTDSSNKQVYFKLPDDRELVFPYSIQLDTNNLKLKYGTSRKVGFVLLPPDVTEDVVTWISSDSNVATVKEGLVTGVGIGSTTITARTVNDLVATLDVEVTNQEIKSNYVLFDEDTEEMEVGETRRLSVNYDPNATIANFEWSSSDPEIISVDNQGNVTALEKGSAVITVRINNSNSSGSATAGLTSRKSDSITIIADGEETPNYLTVTESEITLGTGESKQIEVESDTGNDNFSYISNNEEVVYVSDRGNVTGLKEGEAVVTISAANGVSTSVDVHVVDVDASKIIIQTPSGTTIEKGETLDLEAEVWPEETTDKTIIWSSSNRNVATVNEEGVVTGVKIGRATITAAVGSQSTSIEIIVANEAPEEQPTEPSDVLSEGEIDALKSEVPITFEKESDSSIKITLDVEKYGYANYIDSSKTEFKIVSNSDTVKNLKINDIKKMPLSKKLTFKDGSYGKIQIQASVYLKGNKKKVDLNPTEYTINEKIMVEFSIQVEDSASLASYIPVKEGGNVSDWENSNPEVVSVSEGVVTGLSVGSSNLTGRSNGYFLSVKVNVTDDSEKEVSPDSYTFIYDKCYSAADLCQSAKLKSTTLPKNTSKCSAEAPYYVAKQKTKYEFTCKADKKETTYKGESTYATVDKELTFDHAVGASVAKGETVKITITNWDKLNLKTATVVNTLDNKKTTIKKNVLEIAVPSNPSSKSFSVTVEAKTGDKEPVIYKGTLPLTISDEFVLGSIECENNNTLTLEKGKDKVLSCTLIDKNDSLSKKEMTSEQNATFETSKKSVATVDSEGRVTAVKAGNANITVKIDKVKTVVKVQVEKETPSYEYIKINMKKGKESVKKVNINEEGVTLGYSVGKSEKDKDKITSGLNVTFTSSNPEIIEINENKVVAKAAGTVTITGTYINKAGNEIKGTLEATVNAKEPKITDLNCATEMRLTVARSNNDSDGTANISCSAYDSANNRWIESTENANLFTFKSADTKIVTVNSEGKVTAVKKGNTTINVSAKGYDKKAKINVVVNSGKATYDKIELTNDDIVKFNNALYMKVGSKVTIKYKLTSNDGNATDNDPGVKVSIGDKALKNKIASIAKDGVTVKVGDKENETFKITLTYKNPDGKVITNATDIIINTYKPKTCYYYQEAMTSYGTCPAGYGFIGNNEKRCYKIDNEHTTKKACEKGKNGVQNQQREWSDATNQCFNLSDSKANNDVKEVPTGKFIFGNDKATQKYSKERKEIECYGQCNEARCPTPSTGTSTPPANDPTPPAEEETPPVEDETPPTEEETPSTGDMGVATDVIKKTLGKTGGIIGVTNNNEATTTESGNIREYRYSGADVNNYVTFNDEEWRIVGVFKDEKGEHLKIVRNKALPASMFPATYTYNGTTYTIKYTGSEDYAYWNDGTYNNDWATAGLQYYLNTEKDSNGSNKGYLSYLSTEAKGMIEETKYYLGSVDTYSRGGATPKKAYANERAVSGCSSNKGPSGNTSQSTVEGSTTCRVWANNAATWTGKVGLLYPSDYGYSASSSNWNSELYEFGRGPASTSWLQSGANHSIDEWLLSPSSIHSNGASSWGTTGYVYGYIVNYDLGVRPILNLKSEIGIKSGTGTQEEPYTLG